MVHFDPSLVSPIASIRVALGITAMVSIGLISSDPSLGAALGVGALLVGNASIAGTRAPIGMMTSTSIGMGITAFLSSLTSTLVWVHIPLLALVCAIGGMLVALGNSGNTIGVQAILSFIIFADYHSTVYGDLRLAVYIFLGGLAQTLIAIAIKWPSASAHQRSALAATFGHVASFAGAPDDFSSIPIAQGFDDAIDAINAAGLVGNGNSAALRALVDVGRRMRIELIVLVSLRRRIVRKLGDDSLRLVRPIDELLASASQAFTKISGALQRLQEPEVVDLDATLADLTVQVQRLKERADDRITMATLFAIVEHADALGGQLRGAVSLTIQVTATTRRRIQSRNPLRQQNTFREVARRKLQALRANLVPDSAVFRHALRLTVLVTLCTIVVQHTALGRGYWVAATVALVLRPDFLSTYARGLSRVIGTLFGVGLASLIAVAIHPNSWTSLIVIAIFSWAAASVFRANYGVFSLFVSGLVVSLVSLVSPGTLTAASNRLIDTAIGGVVALAAYALWPTWSKDSAQTSVGEYVVVQGKYLQAVLEASIGARSVDIASLKALARQARLARSNAEVQVTQSLAEPEKRRIEKDQSTGMLASLRRIGIAAHTLRVAVEDHKLPQAVPQSLPLVNAINQSMKAIGETIIDGHAPESPTPALASLRRLHGELATHIPNDQPSLVFLAETDELVDAIDTVAELVHARRPSQSKM